MEIILEEKLRTEYENLCEVCGSKNIISIVEDGKDYEYGLEGSFRVLQCRECKFAFQSPRPLKEQLEIYYPLNYANYKDSKSSIISWLSSAYFCKQAKEISKLMGDKGNFLDIGCSNGHFLKVLKRFGDYQLNGVEIKPEIAQMALDKGFNVYTGQIEDANFEGNSFDLIRMNHLIEHVTFPSVSFYYCNVLLKPGGYLYGETPNLDCIDFRIFKKLWGCLHLPRHIVFFSSGNLEILANKMGYKVVEITQSPMTPGWSLSFQNYLVSRLKLRTSKGRISIYPLLVFLSIPIVQVQRIFKKACVIKFVLQKDKDVKIDLANRIVFS